MKQIRNPLHFSTLNLALLFVVLLSASCASPTPTPPATMPVVVVASPTATVLPTKVPASPTSTATRTPTSTQTRLPRPTATPQPTKTAIPTQYPTLDSQGQQNFVRQELKTNGGCKLPCWWGIVPGSTRFQAAVDSLQQQGFSLYLVRDLTGALTIDMPHSTQLFDYRLLLGLIAKQGVISRLEVGGETYNLTQSRHFASDWQHYSLSNVLQEYGQPSAMGFVSGPPAERDAPVLYTLALLYEPLGLAIRYTGPARFDSQTNVIYVCPRFEQMNNIQLILTSPNDPESKSYSGLTEFESTLEETIGMSVEKFYEKFKNSASKDCLDYHLSLP